MLRDRTHKPSNYLDYLPRRAIKHEPGENGLLVLLRPKFSKGILARWLQPRLRKPYFRVRLDKFGSATWDAIDGFRTIREIGDELYARFGEETEPRYLRTARFIHALHQGSMVDLQPRT